MSASSLSTSWKSVVKFLAELAVVSVGVFLGLLADQWRESHEHRLRAVASLHYFQREILQNEDAIKQRRAYHEKLATDIQTFISSPGPKTFEQFQTSTRFQGMDPVFFERTGWELALATQSLAYLDSDLAYAISRVYTEQQAFENLENSALSALAPTFGASDVTPMARTIWGYLIDANIKEERMLGLYRDLLPRLNASLPPRPER